MNFDLIDWLNALLSNYKSNPNSLVTIIHFFNIDIDLKKKVITLKWK